MWFYFVHQGIYIEVLIVLLPVIIMKTFAGIQFLTTIPLIIFIVIKCYCWLAMISLYKLDRANERRIEFGKQWIINSLMTMQPHIRLTVPVTSYENL
jgi:hypothetical protein